MLTFGLKYKVLSSTVGKSCGIIKLLVSDVKVPSREDEVRTCFLSLFFFKQKYFILNENKMSLGMARKEQTTIKKIQSGHDVKQLAQTQSAAAHSDRTGTIETLRQEKTAENHQAMMETDGESQVIDTRRETQSVTRPHFKANQDTQHMTGWLFLHTSVSLN